MSSDEAIIGGRTYKRPRQEQAQPSQKHRQKKKHLYLVLDDMDDGFTIRKLDADGIPDDLLLSAPPVVRLLSPVSFYSMKFTTLGSHILATSSHHPTTLAYDTATAGVAAGPPLPDALHNSANIFVPTADNNTLYGFACYFRERPPCVEVMSSSSSAERSPRLSSATTIPSSDWSWRSLAPSPFAEEERVWSYAAHPDGHTVFVSTIFCSRNGGSRTFSFDTAADDGRTEWRCHGEWALPFLDEGYYDADLDAWVGLDRDGHIGTCQVPSTVPQRRQQQPELDWNWKVAKDKLWDVQRQVQARRPTLTCMGNARFCLVDRVDEGCTRLLRITTFRLRHSRKGELQIFDRNTTSYPLSQRSLCFPPVAFWV